jgi:hypothetical protein
LVTKNDERYSIMEGKEKKRSDKFDLIPFLLLDYW